MKLSRTKLYLRLLLSVLFVVCLALFSSISHAASSEGTSTQEPTISVPVSSWNELKSNNAKALSLIEVANVPLNEVQNLAVKQKEELNEAHNTITKLENELNKAKTDLVKQEVTLNEMQNSLTELKEKVEKDERTIKRLKMQRNLSQILGAGATIGIAIRG